MEKCRVGEGEKEKKKKKRGRDEPTNKLPAFNYRQGDVALKRHSFGLNMLANGSRAETLLNFSFDSPQ